jgi:hypothetical protein
VESIENEKKGKRESMTHDNANLPQIHDGAAISAGESGDLQVALNLTGG